MLVQFTRPNTSEPVDAQKFTDTLIVACICIVLFALAHRGLHVFVINTDLVVSAAFDATFLIVRHVLSTFAGSVVFGLGERV